MALVSSLTVTSTGTSLPSLMYVEIISPAPQEVRAAFASLEGTKNVLGLTNYEVLLQEYLRGDE